LAVPETVAHLRLNSVDPHDTTMAVALRDSEHVRRLYIDMLGVDEEEVMFRFFQLLLTSRRFEYIEISTNREYPMLEELVEDYFQQQQAEVVPVV
jgi:hypothetical protein